MKNKKFNLCKITAIFVFTYVLIGIILNLLGYTYLWSIRNTFVILFSISIVFCIIQKIIENRKKTSKCLFLILLLVLMCIGLFLFNGIYFMFVSNTDYIDEYYGVKMIKEIKHSFKSPEIKYYDYINPFIRKMNVRIKECYDDTFSIDEYCGTYFYDEDGNEVDTFNGRKYYDFSKIEEKYNKEFINIEEVKKLLKEVKDEYIKDVIDVQYFSNYEKEYINISFVNDEFEFAIESNTAIDYKNQINRFMNDSLYKSDYMYELEIRSESIWIQLIEKDKLLDTKITKDMACDLAEKEAQDLKYQYQEWKSDFKAREYGNIYAANIIDKLSDIDRLYYWEEEWKTDKYKNQKMWQVRLIDRNDPLTNLYIYIDCETGDILGAGKSSD